MISIRYVSILPIISILFLVASLFAAAPATAGEDGVGEKLRGEELVASLRAGGHVIYFRHAATDHSQVDAASVEMGNCSTQRNLSAKGRRQATEIGRAFKALDVPVGKVVTSPYCRARDTGRLAFVAVTTSDDLRFAIRGNQAETKHRAEVLRRMLATPPRDGRNTIIVGHTANLKEAAGIWPESEGVAAIFRPLPDGRFEFVALVNPEEWTALVQADACTGPGAGCNNTSGKSAAGGQSS